MKFTKWTAYSCIVFMLMLTGCGKDNEEISGNGNHINSVEETAKETTAMGRYEEAMINISDQISYGNRLFQLEDNSLVIGNMEKSFVRSMDNGMTWEPDKREWLTDMTAAQTDIMTYAVGADNTVGVIYDANSSTNAETDAATDIPYNPFDTDPKLMLVKPDGTQISVEISPLEEEDSIYGVWISDTGRVFVTTQGTVIYEIDEDGSSKKFLTLDPSYAMPTLMQFQDNLMIMDGRAYDGLLIYDMEKEEYIEDDVLNEFVNTNYHTRTANGKGSYDLYFFPGEENVLYLAGEKGLHRHVIGGSAMEQVIDGNLSIFSNPSYTLSGMMMLDNNEFLALFNGGRLVRFTYNPDSPTVPNEKLKVYSLQDSDTLRQAINLYQIAHPECYVEYEIGMEKGISATRDEALKKLNTKIMAREGPDVLILDNLPVDAYLEKGMFLELTSFLESLDTEDALFENIVDAFRVENKIYMIPSEIQLPILFGEKDYISQMSNLSDIADAVEALRQDYPEKDVTGVCSEKGILRLFSMVSAPYWITDNGGIDKEVLTDYYVQVKRIYDAQMDGLPEDVIREYTDLVDYFQELYGYDPEDSSLYVREGIKYLDYAVEVIHLPCGTLMNAYDYSVLLSMQRMKEYAKTEVRLMNEDIFYPQTLVGINAASNNTKAAENFLRLMLGKENQSSLFHGLPVHKAVFNDVIHGSQYEIEADGFCGSVSVGADNGKIVTIDKYWPEEEQLQVLQDWVESVNTPCIEDAVLGNAVYEEGIAFLQGGQSVEETIEAVERKVSLYMAE